MQPWIWAVQKKPQNQILPLPRAGPEGVLEVISDSGNKTAVSAHGMGSGVLAVDVRAI